MNAVFADTSFFVAGLNQRDAHHAVAKRFSHQFDGSIVTSQWVMLEVANFAAASPRRAIACNFLNSVLADPKVECIPAGSNAFADAWTLYQNRLDKAWSLTDCLSFQIMQKRNLREALTSDHHFEQAGFQILLK